jgi:hypothetical protein
VLLPKLIGTSGSFEIIVFGIVMIVVLKYAPEGLWMLRGRGCFPQPPAAAGLGRRTAAARAQQAPAR